MAGFGPLRASGEVLCRPEASHMQKMKEIDIHLQSVGTKK